jgi:hypothetical protein
MSVPRRRPDVWVRNAKGEHTLLNPESGTVQLLNDSALAIWQLCDGQTRPDEMIEAICELSAAPREMVAEDVQRTLESFERANLLTWVDASPADLG